MKVRGFSIKEKGQVISIDQSSPLQKCMLEISGARIKTLVEPGNLWYSWGEFELEGGKFRLVLENHGPKLFQNSFEGSTHWMDISEYPNRGKRLKEMNKRYVS